MIRKKIFKEIITQDELNSLAWLPAMTTHDLTLNELSLKLSVRTSILKKKLKEQGKTCLDFPKVIKK